MREASPHLLLQTSFIHQTTEHHRARREPSLRWAPPNGVAASPARSVLLLLRHRRERWGTLKRRRGVQHDGGIGRVVVETIEGGGRWGGGVGADGGAEN